MFDRSCSPILDNIILLVQLVLHHSGRHGCFTVNVPDLHHVLASETLHCRSTYSTEQLLTKRAPSHRILDQQPMHASQQLVHGTELSVLNLDLLPEARNVMTLSAALAANLFLLE